MTVLTENRVSKAPTVIGRKLGSESRRRSIGPGDHKGDHNRRGQEYPEGLRKEFVDKELDELSEEVGCRGAACGVLEEFPSPSVSHWRRLLWHASKGV